MKLRYIKYSLAAVLLAGCGALDNGGDGTPTPTVNPGDLNTIFEIQNSSDANHPGLDAVVTVHGVVVSALVADDDRTHFFITEKAGGDYSGIYVYDQNGLTPSGLQIGDEINIEATYTEFNGSSQLVLSSAVNQVDVVNTGATLPWTSVASADIDQIATGGSRAAALEGVLVQIDGDVDVENPSASNFGEFTVTNGSDSLLVDDYIFGDAEVGRFAGETLTNLRGVLYFAFGDYKLEPRNTDDLPAGEIVVSSAYEIQDPAHPNYKGDGSVVKLENLVVTAVEGAGDEVFVAQIAEADYDVTYGSKFSAIYVYRPAGGTTVAVGDVVTLEGTVDEFYDMTELGFVTVTITGAGTGVVPAATVVADPASIANLGVDSEAYESVLVKVEGVDMMVANPDDPMDYGEFEVTGGLRVDDQFFADAETMGRSFANMDVTGILNYGFSNFKLLPRSAADIIEN